MMTPGSSESLRAPVETEPMPAAPSNLWEAFRATTRRNPSAPALIFPEEIVSFGVLEQDALSCAAWLALRKVQQDDVVAIQLPKRRATYALWLSCLRQGVIYVFLDPQNPAGRTRTILDRLRPALLVTTRETPNPFGETIRMADDAPPRGADSRPTDAPPAARVHGLSAAYVMFTSGSTGEPKGAVIPHQGVLSLMRWVHTWVPEPSQQHFSNLNPLHFDNAVFDLYCGLMNGAALVPVETGTAHNPLTWVQRLRQGRASVAFAVPTLFQTLDHLRLLTPASLPDLKVFLFGGEGFPIEALKRFYGAFRGRARLVNVYGPTETSCICSSLEINDSALEAAATGFPSLGRMHDDFTHAVLDEHGTPVQTGETGELWIGGANVGLGYYANPGETDRCFRQDPRQNRYRSIWYRSGDLVREDEEGLLWFQGRVDNQVKVRGHRIELEEIDLTLEAMPDVTRAVAVVVEGADGLEIRAAFEARTRLPAEAVRDHCLVTLPSYMQPARIVQLDALPQNANGKVDRRAARALLEEMA